MQPHGDSGLGVAGRVSVPQFPHGKRSATAMERRGGKQQPGTGADCSVQAVGMIFRYVLSSGTRLTTKAGKRVKAEALPPIIFQVGCRVVQGGCWR